jgi:F-box and WD-40 domain protein MET30
MGDGEEHVHEGREKSITIASAAKFSGQAITPFLAEHIPDQYAPLGNALAVANNNKTDANTKYCYRHRPDLKCRRQADEPSMDQLQRVQFTSFN